MKKKIVIIFISAVIIALLLIYIIPESNSNLKMDESYSGIVVKKYYKRGNTFDIRIANGNIYSTKVSISDSMFNLVELGDSIFKTKGKENFEKIKL